MFQSVIGQSGLGTGRFGAGVWVSLMVHSGLFAGVLGLSGKAVEKISKEPEVVLMRGIPQPPKGNPNPPKVAAMTPPKPKKPRTELVQPKKIPPPPPEAQPAAEPPPEDPPQTAADDLPYVPGSDPNGVEKGGVPGATAIAGMMLGNSPAGTGEEVVPFGSGMTPPRMLSTGKQLEYTYEAARAHVSGVVVARCTITREGDVRDCHIIKGLPFMDEAVLEALTTRHYQPVTFQGRPVNVSYTFNINLRMP